MATDRGTPLDQLEVVGPLATEEVRSVAVLVEAATEADGVRPLSEHVMLHLRYGGDAPVRNFLLYADGTLVAYGHLDVTDEVAGASAELVVAPGHRRRGFGRRMVDAMLAEAPRGRLRLWAHGGLPDARELAASLGFETARSLWQMRRSLYAALPAPAWPEGVRVRTFVPGQDEQAWLTVNAAAFGDHPEQGGWTLSDLQHRMAERWFDPAGFFLAERGDGVDTRLVGFHWTKVHGSHDADHEHPHGHDPIGEVYVVGVHPSERGAGLGKALTLAGLRHLRKRGLPDAMLYVDEDNASAIRLYTALGFTRWEVDVMFSRG